VIVVYFYIGVPIHTTMNSKISNIGLSLLIIILIFISGCIGGVTDVSKCGGNPQCITSLAVEKKQPSYCEEISYSAAKNRCFYYAAIASRDKSICDRTIEHSRVKGYSSVNIPESREVCKKVIDIESKYNPGCELGILNGRFSSDIDVGECYMDLAKRTNDVSVCYAIRRWDRRYNCFSYFAIQEKNISLCEEIDNIDSAISCKARAQLDYTLCNQIEEASTRYYCLEYLAEKLKDPSICSYIEFEKRRVSCEKKLQ